MPYLRSWSNTVYKITVLNVVILIMSSTIYNAIWDANRYTFAYLSIWMLRHMFIRFTNFTVNDDFIVVYFHSHDCNNDNLKRLYLLSFDSLIMFMLQISLVEYWTCWSGEVWEGGKRQVRHVVERFRIRGFIICVNL